MTFLQKKIDKNTPIPLYFQLKNLIVNDIKTGQLKPGDMLMTELKLGELFDLSRTTVRQAVMELVNEGYLYRIKGRGTFIAKPKLLQDFMRKIESYDEQMKRLNMKPRTIVLANEEIAANEDVANALNLDIGNSVIVLKRLRYANEEPIVVLDSYLIMDCREVLLSDMTTTGMYACLARNEKTTIRRVIRRFEAVAANAEIGNYLAIDKGHPIQRVTTVGFNLDGKPIEYSIANYRGDKNQFTVELTM